MKPIVCSSPLGAKRWRAVVAQAVRAHGLNILIILAVSGCSAAGVPETSDPYGKLAQAEQLEQAGRIDAARRHIFQAIEIFEREGDDRGLAQAYRSYAYLVRVNGVDTVLRFAPPDPSQTPTNADGRMDISIEYFQKSLAIAEAYGQQGLVTNLHYNIGVSHYYAGRLNEACLSFDRSLASYRKSVEIKPDLVVNIPPGVKDFPELIGRAKNGAECG